MSREGAQGRLLLKEIEEGSLEDLLKDLRTAYSAQHHLPASRLDLPALDAIWASHGGRLELTGRGALPLLYHIVSTAVSATRNGTVVVVDVDGGFDVSKLKCKVEELGFVHVFRPISTHETRNRLKDCLEGVEGYLLSGRHQSMGRELVAVCVNGGQGGDISVGWRGWLRVESEGQRVPKFGVGISVEEALGERQRRQEVVEESGWIAVSKWGEYRWRGT